jgi:hypothetical protein
LAVVLFHFLLYEASGNSLEEEEEKKASTAENVVNVEEIDLTSDNDDDSQGGVSELFDSSSKGVYLALK